jgi:hypothetical protein
MTDTTTSAELRVTKYLSEFFEEYIRKSRFSRYTSNSNNAVIHIKQDKKRIEIPLVTRLKGDGVNGNETLRGNGEAIGNYGLLLTPTYYRHCVEHTKEELDKPAFDLMKASKSLLMEWAKELQRDHIIEAMNGIYNGTTYSNYGSASDAQMNTWLTNNSDRVLYGTLKSNQSAGDHSASLANIDTSADKLDTDIVSLAKRMCQQASPHVRPLKADEDEEAFIMFCDPYAFRDLKADTAIQQAQREGLNRGKANQPLMTGGDLLWDNVIIREIPEIAVFIDGASSDGVWGANATANGLHNSGASTSRVGVCFLCGQQAVSYGLGQSPDVVVDKDYDFGFKPGVAVELKHDIQKSYFNNVQHGMVTVFVSATGDV